LQEVSASQRNVVFPDTLRNEVGGWRALITGERRLTWVHIVGIALLYLAMGTVLWSVLWWKVHDLARTDPISDRLVLIFGDWVVLFLIFGALFLILRWRVRRALLSGKHANQRNQ
jgi:hypothetical protein